jgi:hypothetical protein
MASGARSSDSAMVACPSLGGCYHEDQDYDENPQEGADQQADREGEAQAPYPETARFVRALASARTD